MNTLPNSKQLNNDDVLEKLALALNQISLEIDAYDDPIVFGAVDNGLVSFVGGNQETFAHGFDLLAHSTDVWSVTDEPLAQAFAAMGIDYPPDQFPTSPCSKMMSLFEHIIKSGCLDNSKTEVYGFLKKNIRYLDGPTTTKETPFAAGMLSPEGKFNFHDIHNDCSLFDTLEFVLEECVLSYPHAEFNTKAISNAYFQLLVNNQHSLVDFAREAYSAAVGGQAGIANVIDGTRDEISSTKSVPGDYAI